MWEDPSITVEKRKAVRSINTYTIDLLEKHRVVLLAHHVACVFREKTVHEMDEICTTYII
jgi:archaellum biogenesis ATPase FlaH